MKPLIVAGLGLVTAVSSASAADMGPVTTPIFFDAPPAYAVSKVYDWTGFYIGLNGGGAFGSTNWSSAPDGVNGTSNVSGGLAGGTAGYNLQTPGLPYVLGVEGDVDWASLTGTLSPPSCAPGCDFTVSWLGTVRLRFGWAFNAFMPYVTGGLAFGGLDGSIRGTPLGTQSANNVGWTAGAGIEYAITPALRVKAEYLFVNLATFLCFTACGGGPITPIAFNANNASVFRVGLSYRLWMN